MRHLCSCLFVLALCTFVAPALAEDASQCAPANTDLEAQLLAAWTDLGADLPEAERHNVAIDSGICCSSASSCPRVSGYRHRCSSGSCPRANTCLYNRALLDDPDQPTTPLPH